MSLQSKGNWKEPTIISTADNILSNLLEARGIKGSDVNDFLSPTLSSIPSWEKLHGVKKASKQILKAAKEGKRIYIHGDFDVDGISATALLWNFLYREVSKVIGTTVDVKPYIPDRVDEGYGLSKSSVDSMIEGGANLIITVDCGVRDRVLIEEYMESSNCEFIVTDHHQPPEDIEGIKYTLVHQMFPKKEYPEQKISGTFVAFLLTLGIREELGLSSEITEQSIGLDLVALSTVTDMMPLVGINRAVVKYGLEQMRNSPRLGIKLLSEVSGFEIKDIDSYHLGFVIGPRINAAGRIGSAMEALKLFLTQDREQGVKIASDLQNLNTLRQENTFTIFNEALSNITETDSLIFVYGDGWHEGVIGLVASKLLERFNKPTIVATKVEDGRYKGSARSIEGFNITDAISKYSDSLERYGGHAQAAGFTVKPDEIEKFKKKLLKFAKGNLNTDLLEKTLVIDAHVPAEEINTKLFNEVEKLKPFGYGNSKPIIQINKLKVIEKFEMSGGKHMKLKVDIGGHKPLSLLMFNCGEDVGLIEMGKVIDIVGYVTLNSWNGYENIEMQVKEWRES